MKAVITVLGHDKVGIIYKVSGILADSKINILDISQTIMQDIFTMIMLVDIKESVFNIDELSKKLDGGCTNTCIEQIFNTIDDLIEGKMICGAGGQWDAYHSHGSGWTYHRGYPREFRSRPRCGARR